MTNLTKPCIHLSEYWTSMYVGPCSWSACLPKIFFGRGIETKGPLWEILIFRISHLNAKSQNGLRVWISLMEIHVGDEFLLGKIRFWILHFWGKSPIQTAFLHLSESC